MNEPLIHLQNVSKYYKLYGSSNDRLKEALHPLGRKYHREFYAIKDLSLKINKGEIVGIVGANGSGKSTLLKLITGVLQPNGGAVHVRGKISALLELGAGFNPEFTGYQNVFFYGMVLGFSQEEMDERVQRIVEFADLGEFIHQPLKSYSSGMRARLGFAVAINVDPEILILDEVLAVGDAMFTRKCYARMKEFFDSGRTILYVSHNIPSMVQFCTQSIFIDKGKLIMEGNIKEVAQAYQRFVFTKPDQRQQFLDNLLIKKNNEVEEVGDEVRRDFQTGFDQSEKEEFISSHDVTVGYLEDFIPQSTEVLKNYDVDIVDCYLQTLSGDKVNVLEQGKEYKCIFTLSFGCEFSEVSVGFQVLNEKGLLISSAALVNAGMSFNVNEGDLVQIEGLFTCNLLPGNFYITLNSSTKINNEWIRLIRIVDALVFKVLPPQEGEVFLGQGLVDLQQHIAWQKL